MSNYVKSSDGVKIHYTISGQGEIALLFVHGWLGNGQWWNSQSEYFSKNFTVVLMDLAGHGKSDKSRSNWTSKQYAEDIKNVSEQIKANKLILIGHSMSGAYVAEASILIPKTAAIILVDTLQDLDQIMTIEQASQMFELCRKDFKSTVENILPQYLFAKSSPKAICSKIQNEFLAFDPNLAVSILEPLYKMDIREIAKKVIVPVRAINSNFSPTNCFNNQKYFHDYNYCEILGTGHYPMLEKPETFNQLLEETLKQMKIPV
ncbi:MAG: alpha/beta hydrolase [Oligoflexia bacterium]|nr:alpha/beta hydrolase [Oligoflexia bacterium]